MALEVMGLLNTAFAGGLGQSLGKGSAPAGPSNATSGAYGSGLDGSGWIVNFKGIQSASANQDKSGADGLLASTGTLSPLVIFGVVVLVGIVAWKKSSSKK